MDGEEKKLEIGTGNHVDKRNVSGEKTIFSETATAAGSKLMEDSERGKVKPISDWNKHVVQFHHNSESGLRPSTASDDFVRLSNRIDRPACGGFEAHGGGDAFVVRPPTILNSAYRFSGSIPASNPRSIYNASQGRSADTPGGHVKRCDGRIKKAWETINRENDCNGFMPQTNRKIHVQSIAKSRGREQLAEEVVCLKEQLQQSQDREQKLQVSKRRLDSEMQSLRSNLNKAEELLRNKSRSSSPNKALAGFNRSPECTSLVHSLKSQNRDLRQARDQLEAELAKLKRSTRLTRVSELETEVSLCHEEMQRQKAITEFLFHRLDEAERATQAAADIAANVARKMDHGMPGTLSCPSGTPLTGKSLTRTMELLQNAHQTLILHANSVKARLPVGANFQQLEGDGGPMSKPTRAPVQVLKYLRAHISRMDSALLGLPGGNIRGMDPTPRPKSRSKQRDGRAKESKQKEDVADAIKFHVGSVLSTLESEGCDGEGFKHQMHRLIEALDGLRSQFADAMERQENQFISPQRYDAGDLLLPLGQNIPRSPDERNMVPGSGTPRMSFPSISHSAMNIPLPDGMKDVALRAEGDLLQPVGSLEGKKPGEYTGLGLENLEHVKDGPEEACSSRTAPDVMQREAVVVSEKKDMPVSYCQPPESGPPEDVDVGDIYHEAKQKSELDPVEDEVAEDGNTGECTIMKGEESDFYDENDFEDEASIAVDEDEQPQADALVCEDDKGPVVEDQIMEEELDDKVIESVQVVEESGVVEEACLSEEEYSMDESEKVVSSEPCETSATGGVYDDDDFVDEDVIEEKCGENTEVEEQAPTPEEGGRCSPDTLEDQGEWEEKQQEAKEEESTGTPPESSPEPPVPESSELATPEPSPEVAAPEPPSEVAVPGSPPEVAAPESPAEVVTPESPVEVAHPESPPEVATPEPPSKASSIEPTANEELEVENEFDIPEKDMGSPVQSSASMTSSQVVDDIVDTITRELSIESRLGAMA